MESFPTPRQRQSTTRQFRSNTGRQRGGTRVCVPPELGSSRSQRISTESHFQEDLKETAPNTETAKDKEQHEEKTRIWNHYGNKGGERGLCCVCPAFRSRPGSLSPSTGAPERPQVTATRFTVTVETEVQPKPVRGFQMEMGQMRARTSSSTLMTRKRK